MPDMSIAVKTIRQKRPLALQDQIAQKTRKGGIKKRNN